MVHNKRLRCCVQVALAATVIAATSTVESLDSAYDANAIASALLQAARSVRYVTTPNSVVTITRNGVVDLTKKFDAATRDRCKRLGPSHPDCQPTPIPGVTVVLAEANATRIVLTFEYTGGAPFDGEAHLSSAATFALHQVQTPIPVLFREVYKPPDSANFVVEHQLTYDPVREILQRDF